MITKPDTKISAQLLIVFGITITQGVVLGIYIIKVFSGFNLEFLSLIAFISVILVALESGFTYGLPGYRNLHLPMLTALTALAFAWTLLTNWPPSSEQWLIDFILTTFSLLPPTVTISQILALYLMRRHKLG